MQRRSLLAVGTALAMASLTSHAAKSPWPPKPAVPTDFNPQEFVTELEQKGSGFVTGNPNAKNVAFMVIDVQCPWCAWEYEQVLPFSNDVQFRWYPVAVLNPWSELQGAAILMSDNPSELYNKQRERIKDPEFKGIDIRGQEDKIPFERRLDVWTNTKIYRRAGGRSVPFGVLRTATGQLIPLPEENAMGFEKRTGIAPSPTIFPQ